MAKSSTDSTPLPLIRDFGNIAALAWEGKVFNTENPTLATGVTGQTSLALTLATIQLRNLGSKAMVPLWLKFAQAGSVAGGRIEVVVYALDNDQFTSGTALEVNCTNRQKASPSQVSAWHTATIPALTADNAVELYSTDIFMTVLLNNADNNLDLVGGRPGCWVINPGGGLVIYTNAASTGPTWHFDLGWAELEV